jgi:hypothetical protein
MNNTQKQFVELFQTADAMSVDDSFLRFYDSGNIDPNADQVCSESWHNGEYDEQLSITQSDFQDMTLLEDGTTFQVAGRNVSFHHVSTMQPPALLDL